MKKNIIFICIFGLAIIINLIPLFVFKEQVSFSQYSYIALIIMVLVIINGISSYFLRHKGNFLSFGKPRGSTLSSDKDYTFTEEYNKEFFGQFLIYSISIPFYIPCIFFASKWVHSLWTLCVLLAPQLIFVTQGISSTIKDVKEYRITQQKRDQELKEQQRKEEMGKFK